MHAASAFRCWGTSLLAQTNGICDLSTLVAAQRRDAHLGHDFPERIPHISKNCTGCGLSRNPGTHRLNLSRGCLVLTELLAVFVSARLDQARGCSQSAAGPFPQPSGTSRTCLPLTSRLRTLESGSVQHKLIAGLQQQEAVHCRMPLHKRRSLPSFPRT